MAFSRLSSWGCVLFGVACAPSLELPRTDQSSLLEVSPAPVSGATSRSIRITSPHHAPRLFEGNLSARQVSSLSRGETTASLAEDEIELLRVASPHRGQDAGAPMADPPSYLWLPTRLLDAAQAYTVVAGSEHIGFTTLTEEPTLHRVWPAETVAAHALFCLESSTAFEPLGDAQQFQEATAVSFGGVDERDLDDGAGWTQLAHSPPCWLWQWPAARVTSDMAISGETIVDAGSSPVSLAATPEFAGAAVQPTWSMAPDGEPPELLTCTEDEQAVGFGCMVVEDDRLLVRSSESFWRVGGDARGWFVLGPGRSGVVRGLKPNSRHTLTFLVYFPNSAPTTHTTSVTMGSVRPHVVINEVMADPAGTEPDQEWVELYNDGAAPVNLQGWGLKDDGGEMVLPGAWLAPSGYALLVNDTYVPNAAGEPVPEPNVLTIRLPALGKSGLSNSGEALRLVDKSDMVVASFPATPKPTPGVSVARGAPWQVDEPSAFGQHALPGASPGAPNRLRAVSAGGR